MLSSFGQFFLLLLYLNLRISGCAAAHFSARAPVRFDAASRAGFPSRSSTVVAALQDDIFEARSKLAELEKLAEVERLQSEVERLQELTKAGQAH